jgi:hypothetical protein
MNDNYWETNCPEFLKNKESFDKQMIEFLKNVADIHIRNESNYNLVVQIPSIFVNERHTLHKYSRKNIITFYSVGDSINGYRPMKIEFFTKLHIPKVVIPRISDSPIIPNIQSIPNTPSTPVPSTISDVVPNIISNIPIFIPTIPVENKKIMDDETRIYFENMKKNIIQLIENMWDKSMNEYFSNYN